MHNISKSFSKIFACVLCFALLFSTLTSCRGSSSEKKVNWLLSSSPKNLDPQTSEIVSEQIIIKNCFSGLFGRNSYGQLTTACADHFDVSKSGRRYVFYLKDNIFWSKIEKNKIEKYAPITADDFVFAVQRIFTDNPNSQIIQPLKNIVNSDKVLNGAPVSKLGIYAKDEKTFVVDLKEKNPLLPEIFTSSQLFPCNRNFFKESKGKYGLSKDSVLFNGSFCLKSWDDSTIKLIKNTNSEFVPNIDSVLMFLPREKRQADKLLKNGDIDASFLPKENVSSFINDSNYTVSEKAGKIWVLLFNPESELWKNEDLRKAVSLCTQRDTLISKENHLTTISRLVSSSAMILSENYTELTPSVSAPNTNFEKAKGFYKKASEQLGTNSLYNAKILIPKDNITSSFSALNQIYQRELSLYFSPEYISENDVISKIKSGDFDVAAIPLYIENDSPSNMLEKFAPSSPSCIFKITDKAFTENYSAAIRQSDTKKAAEYFGKAESAILNTSLVIPVCIENRYFVSSSSVSGFELDNSGSVLFANVKKK